MPPITPCGSADGVAGEQDEEADEGDDRPPPLAAELAGGDQDLGDEGEFLAGFSKQAGELGDEKGEEYEHQHNRGGEDDGWVEKRGNDAAAEVLDEREVGALALEDLGKGAGGLAGGDEVAIQRVEGAAAVLQSGRKTEAVAHALAEAGGDGLDAGFFLALLNDFEGAFEFESGLEEFGEFLGEIQKLGGVEAGEGFVRSSGGFFRRV